MSKMYVVTHGIMHRRTNRCIKLGTRRMKLDVQNLKYNQHFQIAGSHAASKSVITLNWPFSWIVSVTSCQISGSHNSDCEGYYSGCNRVRSYRNISTF